MAIALRHAWSKPRRVTPPPAAPRVSPGPPGSCFSSRPPPSSPQQRPDWWESARQRLPAGGLLLMASLTLLVWSVYFSVPAPDGRLRVTLLDLGSPLNPAAGEAVLIQTPSGSTVLIDGGPGD